MSAVDRCSMSVMLSSKDPKAACAYYTEKLGFEVKEAWPNAKEPMWANLVLGGQSVMVGAPADPDQMDGACIGDEATKTYMRKAASAFREHPAGVGVQVYLLVEDVDAYFADLKARGAEPETEPITQFYGIRDFAVIDPDGYHLVFYSAVTLETCQSCGMPLTDARPGQTYCAYCTDEKGELKPYEEVFEGAVQGYFMGMQKMERADAEKAASEMLGKMPAWAGR